MSQIRVLCMSLFTGLVSSQSTSFDPCAYAPEDVLVRDVIVIGGGASGTYGAIALKDMGRSVAVVEKNPHFGGHVNTYTDPETGLALDFGVQGYGNDSITRAFFSRFDIPLIPLSEGDGQITVDFGTGENVTTLVAGSSMVTYSEQTNMYYPEPALGLHLPQPVPEDLLLPFRDFVTKYSIQNASYTIWRYTSPGKNLLDQLTLYVILGCNAASTPLLGGQGSDVMTRNNSELFGKAEEEVGSNALLSSQVIAAIRSNDSVSLVVQTPTTKKLILASQILFSAPIVLDNLNTFDLDTTEYALFSQVYYSCWYTAVVTDTGLQPGYVYENAASDTLYNIPIEPYTFRIGITRVSTIYTAYYGSMEDLPESEVKARIAENIQIISGNSSIPRFLDFASHVPFKQQVPATAVVNGFYNQLNNLQGYRGMHYTGNALDASGSSSLFNFTLHLLPNINQGIDAHPVDPTRGICNNAEGTDDTTLETPEDTTRIY
ncbi:conserved hypothetical protein [Talaromyces stipitatus ATCC 10500]|uniref:FAD dependent oxidoreductase n=2 Tax=Talaromyces stipitatus TaxID=28564 RepID=B8MFY3_TALSN|nr:uncharacterized protein TSTA_009710 [Talaromyces stipitatus ATCC 10500]AWS21674.1 FAD dependent oxidoreductase [Talaromyces stipitatus]AWS21688.1 NAD/FAD dependent oxidoreductase [Talaromyces stipitatus]EED15850.1 conserved hypothetical protein [Talaromyces stipitatus ATCC 10500]